MAKQRNWSTLAASTRKRYLSHGKTQGLSAGQVESYYMSGGKMAAYRGHQPPSGLSERQWQAQRQTLIQGAAGLTFGRYRNGKIEPQTATQVIAEARRQGMSTAAIARALINRRTNTVKYRRGDKKAGRDAWGRAPKLPPGSSALSLFWYH